MPVNEKGYVTEDLTKWKPRFIGQIPPCSVCGNGHIENAELGLCATCNGKRRKAERLAAKPEKKRKAIPKTSAKRKEKLKEYTPLRKQYLLDHPECEIKLIGCTKVAVEIHHASTSDLDFLNTSTWKSGCRHCHTIVETILSAEIRREKGLLITFNSTEPHRI